MIGLEGGRELARRRQRRKQLKDKVFGVSGAIIALAVVASVAYIGYTVYDETQAKEKLESEQRQAELDGEGTTIRDAIDELEETPRWNGPGNPTFGVGDGDEEIEVIAPATLPDAGG